MKGYTFSASTFEVKLKKLLMNVYRKVRRSLPRKYRDCSRDDSEIHSRLQMPTLPLSSWQPTRPNDDQNLSIPLNREKFAMKGMPHMDDFNTVHVLRQHWETLPGHSRSKWTERNNKSKIAKERIADFEEFSQFVRQQAKLAIVPVFSEESVSKPHEGEKGIGIHLKFGGRSLHIRKETTLATGLNQGNRNRRTLACPLCNSLIT